MTTEEYNRQKVYALADAAFVLIQACVKRAEDADEWLSCHIAPELSNAGTSLARVLMELGPIVEAT